MQNFDTTQEYSVIVGMGATGLSIANYLHSCGERFCVFDTRASSVLADTFHDVYPDAPLYFATIDDELITQAKQIYLSPGVSREEQVIVLALENDIPVIGDIELFVRATEKPVIGITGSNGKSTVTTLVGMAAAHSGLKTAVGGNIGVPALDLLQTSADVYVLELSSFQLESITTLGLAVGCVLNVSPDHMDRYANVEEYARTKRRIYDGAQHLVFNLQDALTTPSTGGTEKRSGFGFQSGMQEFDSHSQQATFYLFNEENACLERNGEILIHKDNVKIKGMHNIANALALYAIAEAFGISPAACGQVLESFPGLPHRTEWVAELNGVTFINDSKATNIGAAEAAIVGLVTEFKGIVLIAGGDGKGADFTSLGNVISEHVRVLLLIGRDAKLISEAVNANAQLQIKFCASLQDAVEQAKLLAHGGEVVLLSPACASLDMFNNFEERGEIFTSSVLNNANSSEIQSQGKLI